MRDSERVRSAMRVTAALVWGVALAATVASPARAGEEGADAPRRIQVRRVEPPKWRVELEKTLRERKLSFQFERTPLPDVVGFVRAVTGTAIDIAPGAAKSLSGVEVTLTVNDLDIGSILDLLVAYGPRGAAWGVREGGVVIGTAKDVPPRTDPHFDERVYDVGALVGDAKGEELVAIVRAFAAPGSWDGKRTRLELADDGLHVRQRDDGHEAVRSFLERLLDRSSNARRSDARRRLEKALGRVVTVEFAKSDLVVVLHRLSELTGANVVLDPRMAGGKLPALTLKPPPMSARSVIRRVAIAAGCHVRIEDGVVMLTQRFPAELRLYDVRDLKATGLAEQAKASIDDGSWAKVPAPAVWNGLLLVDQSDENHGRIEHLLEGLRAAK